MSQYPAVNHTFILREIRALRSLGSEVHIISIRPPDRPSEGLSQEERFEQQQTFTVLAAGAGAIAFAHAETLARRPLAYVAGLWDAFRLAGSDPRRALSHLFYFGEAVVAGHHMRRLGLRHVHSHFSSTVALLLSRVFAVTFSATIHGPDEFNDAAGFHLAQKIARAMFVCAISHYGRSQLMRASDPKHWDKLEVAPLGVDSSVFLPRPHRESPRQIELLCVGRLAAAKAQQVLLAAVDRLVRQGRHAIRLRLVGDGPDRPGLEQAVAARGLGNHVTLEGPCDQDRVLAFYRQTDLFVLASFAEGVPVVLMEAMAMEIPCVATWIAGIPELIRHGIDGWLVPPADEEEFAAAIARLIDDPQLRQQLGRSARERVREKYDLRRNTERLAEIYRRRLSSNVP